MKTEKVKEKEVYWRYIAIGIILYLILAFFLKFFPFDNTSIKDCIDNCVYNEWDCVDIESWDSQSGISYVLFDDYESCNTDLEICVSDCK